VKALITGYPGTGKSSVALELKRRGRYAYDTEAMRGYMHAESVQTGERISLPSPVPRGWFESTGGYNWDPVRIAVLLKAHDDVYVCALADNQEDFYDTFDTIFLLQLNEGDLVNRLQSRTTTTYGKDPGERADILLHHQHFEQSLLEAGAISISAKQGLTEVVNEILSYVTS
jgi:hypothetical protein